MKTKEKLLTLFEKNKGVYFSGEEIADKLSVSRTAVWKAVNSLRKEGYKIHAAQNKGYCLAADTDILSVQGIQKYLESSCSQLKLTVLPAAASTNALLREKAAAGAPEGCVLIGINVYPPENGFPEELKNIAGAVFSEAMGDGKNRLAAAFLNCFMALCQSLEDSSYIQEYRERSFLIGREILVLLPEGTKKASALDVDGECRLIVRYKDGTVAALDSGEVRVQERKHLHTPTE